MAAEVRAGRRFLGSKVCALEVREELGERAAGPGRLAAEEANRSMGGLEIESGKGLEQV